MYLGVDGVELCTGIMYNNHREDEDGTLNKKLFAVMCMMNLDKKIKNKELLRSFSILPTFFLIAFMNMI